MLIIKVIFLQLFWLVIVLYGASINSIFLIGISICLVVINYIIYKPKISIGRVFLSQFYSFYLGTLMAHD